MSLIPLANVRDARFELKETTANAVVHDVQMLGFLRQASDRFTAKLGMRFLPYLETKTYTTRVDVTTGRKWKILPYKGLLVLPETLLALPSLVTDGDGNALVYNTDYIEDPPGQYPITALRLLNQTTLPCSAGGCKSWYATQSCANGELSLTQITGVWGFHSDYANAYINTLDTVRDNPLTAVATTLTVTSITGVDAYGRTPRFSPGQLLKVENELLGVLSVHDDVVDTLTVLRGANGTTAAAHAQGTAIYTYEVDLPANQAALRWACYPYKRRGDYGMSTFDTNTGVYTKLPFDAPGDVIGIIEDYLDLLSSTI